MIAGGSEACSEAIAVDFFQEVAGCTTHERIDNVGRALRSAENDDQRSGEDLEILPMAYKRSAGSSNSIRQMSGCCREVSAIAGAASSVSPTEEVVGLERFANAATVQVSRYPREGLCQSSGAASRRIMPASISLSPPGIASRAGTLARSLERHCV